MINPLGVVWVKGSDSSFGDMEILFKKLLLHLQYVTSLEQ